MKVLHERVAGIDVHKDMIKVAIRSPGAKPWTRRTEILTFGTFYGVLRAMARDLRRRGVTHVVMEASGGCTEPVYYALCELDFTDGAARNGPTLPGNSEVVEAAVDKIKMIKRQTCGRAGFPRPKRILVATWRARYHHEIRQIQDSRAVDKQDHAYITKCAGLSVFRGEPLV